MSAPITGGFRGAFLATPSMRTTGAYDDRPTAPAHKRCLQSCLPAVVRPCCCTSCCTGLTLTCQSNSVRFPPAMLDPLTWPLRPQANARCDVPPLFLCLTCLAPSVDILWRPLQEPTWWSPAARMGKLLDRGRCSLFIGRASLRMTVRCGILCAVIACRHRYGSRE